MKKHIEASNRPGTGRPRRYQAAFACSQAEVRETQALRYQVFGRELGARLSGGARKLDVDGYDAHCRHLLVRDTASGEVVASTRLLDGAGARAAGGFYAENEFYLGFLAHATGPLLELGRTCVDARYRGGAVIATLWSKLAATVVEEGVAQLFGCASIGLQDGGRQAQQTIAYLRQRCWSPVGRRAQPYQCLPMLDRPATAAETRPRLPALLKAYVSLGAEVCGEPYWDRDFDCLDVFMMLDVSRMASRYARHFAVPRESGFVAHVA